MVDSSFGLNCMLGKLAKIAKKTIKLHHAFLYRNIDLYFLIHISFRKKIFKLIFYDLSIFSRINQL